MADPSVVITPHEGGFIALMHEGPGKIQQFVADSLQSLETMIASVGVSEFQMVQDDARAFAKRVMETFHGHRNAWSEAQQEIALLRAELGKAYGTIKSMAAKSGPFSEPKPEPAKPAPAAAKPATKA